MMRKQQGYFLILAVIFVMVIGVMGTIIAYTFAGRANISAAQYQGWQAFYIAESGLEIASRLLVGTSRVSGQERTCANLTGYSLVTHAAVLNGTFTATAVGGGLYSAATTLSAGITATSNSLTVASVTGMASHGRVRIEGEAIDYAAISGTTLTGLNRGMAGTTASSHASGVSVSQSVCLVNVQAGIPSIAAPKYSRQLEMAVEILNGSSDIWAVGTRHRNQFSIIRWNTPLPSVWNDVSPGADLTNREDLNAVSLSSTTNGWAVGTQKGSNFTMVYWNGSLPWVASPLAGACSGQDLLGVAVTSTAEAWAVGARYRPACAASGNYRYTLLKWNGSTWTVLTPSTSPSIPTDAAANPNLNGVSVFDSNGDGFAEVGFAVGDSGRILRYTGTTWSASTVGSANLLAVSVVSATEAWAVGASGTILKWNGSSWSAVTSPTTNQLNGISMVDSNGDGVAEAGWAVGNSGTIIYYNGSTWAAQTSGTTRTVSGVVALSSATAYAVGASNTLLLYSSGSWTAATPPTSFSATYYGMAFVPGGGLSVTGTQVGSWQQIFR